MPSYRKSRARKTFDSEMTDVFRAVRLAYSRRCRLPEVRVFVLSNAMLMGSAKLETYVEDLVGDWVTSVNASGFLTNSLPSAVRARFFCQQAITATYERFVVRRDEFDLTARVSNILDADVARFLVNGHASPPLNAGWILHERKYPSPKNWRHLFNRVGIPQIFHLLNGEAGTDVELLLTSFNDLRSSLAHEGIPPGLSATDIRIRLREIALMIRWLDRVLFQQIGTIDAVNLWTE